MAIPRSKNGRGSPSVDPPKSDNKPKPEHARPLCLHCMNGSAVRIRIIDVLQAAKYFCSKPCALSYAMLQADDSGADWCTTCGTWATEYSPCACERDELLGTLDNSLWPNAAEAGDA